MEIITQETIVGQVQEVASKDDYIVRFVVKAIREGEVNILNVSSNAWQAWNLRAGDKVSLRGKLTSTVWEDPFLGGKVETAEMEANQLNRLAA